MLEEIAAGGKLTLKETTTKDKKNPQYINHPHLTLNDSSIVHALGSQAALSQPPPLLPPVSIVQLGCVNTSFSSSSSSNTPMSLMSESRHRGKGKRSNHRGWATVSCSSVG